MYSLPTNVVTGISIIAALQNYPKMPSSAELELEMSYFEECIADSERFYGVAFKRTTGADAEKRPRDQFDVTGDVRAHLEEFYFGGSQDVTFGFRPRAYYRLVIEPLLESMSTLSHDEVLDFTPNVVEQMKEQLHISSNVNTMEAPFAYRMYQQITAERRADKTTKAAVEGIMKLRKRTIALQKEINRTKPA